jgi:hypothetical protein
VSTERFEGKKGFRDVWAQRSEEGGGGGREKRQTLGGESAFAGGAEIVEQGGNEFLTRLAGDGRGCGRSQWRSDDGGIKGPLIMASRAATTDARAGDGARAR